MKSQPQIRIPSAGQRFGQAAPLDFRKPVHCRAEELDLLAEAARAAGYCVKGIRRDTEERGGFFLGFVPVPAYLPTTNTPQP